MKINDIIRRLDSGKIGIRDMLPDCEKVQYLRAGIVLVKVSLN